MFDIGEKVDVPVSGSADSVIGQFDGAVGFARRLALDRFGVDENGHINNVKDAERSSCSINVEFVSFRAVGGMQGWDHVYEFRAWVSREDGEMDDG